MEVIDQEITRSRLDNINCRLFYPGTALALFKILDTFEIDIRGAETVVVGQSRQVGYPISLLLRRLGASVTTCEGSTKLCDLESAVGRADIVVSATGKIDPFDARLLKQGSCLIDVGFNWDDRKEQFRGDVDFSLAVERCALLSLIPGGIGPVNASV